MKIKKKVIAMMMTFAVVGSLVGCGQSDTQQPPETEVVTPEDNASGELEEDNVEVEASELANLITTITEGMELPNQIAMLPEMFADTYGIDTNLLKDYYVSISMMNVQATEIAVFELKDEKDADAVMAGIEKRQKALEEQWSSYLPEQYELVKNYKVAQKGNKILFVISDQADQIVDNFNNVVQ